MIGTLRGKLLSKKPDGTIVEVNGVGYQVSVSLNTLSSLPEEGGPVFLHIHTHVRDDALQLFGFGSADEKRIFMTLISVSGIGPKLALSILSGVAADKFGEIIETENTAFLSSIPGVGKKTANRLILELKEKLPVMREKRDPLYEDALSALVNLGYRKNFVVQALEKVSRTHAKDIETLIREALKYLTNE